MTLQTELPAFPPNEKYAIGRTVRVVTGDAAFHLCRRMLVYEGSPLLHVALDAGFRRRLDEAGRIQSAVNAMTVRALHQSFRNPVVHGQSELTANRRVTGVAKVRLFGLQEAVLQPAHIIGSRRNLRKMRQRELRVATALIFHSIHEVRRVTVTAGNSCRHVSRMQKRILLPAALVTGKATLGVLFRTCPIGKDQFVCGKRFGLVAPRRLLRFRVRPARAMAGFATDRGLCRRIHPRMGGLVELRELRAMAGSASIIPDDLVGRQGRRRLHGSHRRSGGRPGNPLRQKNTGAGKDANHKNQHRPTTTLQQLTPPRSGIIDFCFLRSFAEESASQDRFPRQFAPCAPPCFPTAHDRAHFCHEYS